MLKGDFYWEVRRVGDEEGGKKWSILGFVDVFGKTRMEIKV